MGSFQVLGVPKVALSTLAITENVPYIITAVLPALSDAYVEFYLDRIAYRLDWRTATSVGKTNLFDPAITQCNDGDPATYHQSSTTSTTPVNISAKFDMGDPNKIYVVACKVGTRNTHGVTSSPGFLLAASPDDVTYTTIASAANPSITEAISWLFVVTRGYRYFKAMLQNPVAGYVQHCKLYELGIWAV
jgi:hypothetical protein